jgi:hypothetical protein
MLPARRRCRTWIVAALLAAVAGTGDASAAQEPDPAPPALLADLLRGQPSWRLLDPARDLAGDYTVDQLKELDRWPPWLEQDFDRDGRDDVAAVIVRRGDKDVPAFTVLVVHGAAPARAVLVVPFSPQRIFGVSEGIADDTVMPLRCADCDANIWFRWNGASYEPWLHAVGESVRIGGETGGRLTLFDSPRPEAGRTGDVPICSRAQVQEVGGEANRRWYRVEVVAPSFPRGWVPQQLVREGEECGG